MQVRSRHIAGQRRPGVQARECHGRDVSARSAIVKQYQQFHWHGDRSLPLQRRGRNRPVRPAVVVSQASEVRLMSSETEIRPFRVDTPDKTITDLRRRIAATRSPSRELVADRSQGVQLATIQELARYWAADYDWHACV